MLVSWVTHSMIYCIVRETTTNIGFCAPFFDSHVPLWYSHMGHFKMLGVQFPVDCASDAIQRSRGSSAGNRCTRILYGIVFPVEGPYVHRKSTGRTYEPLGGSWTNAALTRFATFAGLFSNIVVMGYSSATAPLYKTCLPTKKKRILDQIPATQMMTI